MERCKHCGEVVDRTDFIYCPACGKLLSEQTEEKQGKKKKDKSADVVAVSKADKKQKTTDSADNVKKLKYSSVEGGKTRKSYIVFGIFALLLGILFVLTSGYWGASSNLFGEKFAQKMTDLSDKILGKVINNTSKSLKIDSITTSGILFFTVYLTIITIICIITFFSLFSKRTTAGHVFVKIGALILLNFVIVYSFCNLATFSLMACLQNSEILKADQVQNLSNFVADVDKLLKNASLGCMIGGGVFLIIGIILSITKFGNPYNTTFYQYFRAFFFLACSVLYYFIIAKTNKNEFLNKLSVFILTGIPYYLIITSLCMFFSAKMKKIK